MFFRTSIAMFCNRFLRMLSASAAIME